MIKNKNILITGGAGFIGSHLVELLIKEGNFIIILDNFNDYYEGKDANIQSVVKNYEAKDYHIIRGDITNKEIFYLDHLPKSMIVLGGGPIGTEMSQAFCRLGTTVSVVDMEPQILAKEDADMAEAVKEVLSTEGVNFYLNSAIEEVNDLGKKRSQD